jgi:hypothetical protein
MTAPNGWGKDPGWQRFCISWYLVWPGWVLGWLVIFLLVTFDLLAADIRIAAVIIVPATAGSVFLRMFTLPQKRFERFRVEMAKDNAAAIERPQIEDALRVSALVLAQLTVFLALTYGVVAWINTPNLSALGVLAYALWNPWMWNSIVMGAIERQGKSFRLQLVPHER